MRCFTQFLKSGFESLLVELFVGLQLKKNKKKEEEIFIINLEYVRNQSEFIINLWMFTNKDVHTHTHTHTYIYSVGLGLSYIWYNFKQYYIT